MPSKVIYIYKLFHKNFLIHPKFYIGSTCNYEKRKNDHRFNTKNNKTKKFNYKLYRYIRKHGGIDNFDFFVLNIHEYTSNIETRKLEQSYIDLFQPQLNKNRALRKQKIVIKKDKLKEKSDDSSSNE